jgi:hypothetical protein
MTFFSLERRPLDVLARTHRSPTDSPVGQAAGIIYCPSDNRQISAHQRDLWPRAALGVMGLSWAGILPLKTMIDNVRRNLFMFGPQLTHDDQRRRRSTAIDRP